MALTEVVDLDTVDPVEALNVEGAMPVDIARALVLRVRAERHTGRSMTVAEAEAWYTADRAARETTE